MRKLLMLAALTGGLTLAGTAGDAQAQWYSYGYSRPYYGSSYSYGYSQPYYGRSYSYGYSQPYYGYSYSRPYYGSYGYSRPYYGSYYGYSRPYHRGYYGGSWSGRRSGVYIGTPGFSFGYWR